MTKRFFTLVEKTFSYQSDVLNKAIKKLDGKATLLELTPTVRACLSDCFKSNYFSTTQDESIVVTGFSRDSILIETKDKNCFIIESCSGESVSDIDERISATALGDYILLEVSKTTVCYTPVLLKPLNGKNLHSGLFLDVMYRFKVPVNHNGTLRHVLSKEAMEILGNLTDKAKTVHKSLQLLSDKVTHITLTERKHEHHSSLDLILFTDSVVFELSLTTHYSHGWVITPFEPIKEELKPLSGFDRKQFYETDQKPAIVNSTAFSKLQEYYQGGIIVQRKRISRAKEVGKGFVMIDSYETPITPALLKFLTGGFHPQPEGVYLVDRFDSSVFEVSKQDVNGFRMTKIPIPGLMFDDEVTYVSSEDTEVKLSD